MTISEIAKVSGLSSKTIRFYEAKGLIDAPSRKNNGYRCYSNKDLVCLVFIKRVRELGFTLLECKKLIDFLNDPERRSADVRDSMSQKLTEVEARIEKMKRTRKLLIDLIDDCQDDERPECSIIEYLSKFE